MGDVIDFRAKTPRETTHSYFVRVDVDRDGSFAGGSLLDVDLSHDSIRLYAEYLRVMYRAIMAQLAEETDDPDDLLLVDAMVFASSRVSQWTSNEMTGKVRLAWFGRRLRDMRRAAAQEE